MFAVANVCANNFGRSTALTVHPSTGRNFQPHLFNSLTSQKQIESIVSVESIESIEYIECIECIE